MLEYKVTARRVDNHGAEAAAKQALVVLDTDLAGRTDAFNPAELLLASLAGCILKSTTGKTRKRPTGRVRTSNATTKPKSSK